MPILDQGVHSDVPMNAYHDICTPAPALSSSIAKALVHKCEKVAWFESELNPNREHEEDTKFDIGTAVHYAVMQPEQFARHVKVISGFDDFKKTAARDARDSARANGLVPLLDKHMELVDGMREAVKMHPIAKGLFAAGEAEQTIVWFDKQYGIWCKARPDFWSHDLVDIKSVPSCDADSLSRIIWQHHWYQQAAWYLEGAKAVGRAVDDFVFCAIEKTAPHLIVPAPLDGDALGWGAYLNDYAKRRWAHCLKTGMWRGYEHQYLSLPGWARFQLERRREFGEWSEKPGQKALAAAQAAQAPLDSLEQAFGLPPIEGGDDGE